MTLRGWWIHTTIVMSALLVFMAVAAASEWPWWEYAFFADSSAVSWLSSALLAANAAVALRITTTRALPRVLGAALTIALALLALDEQFLLHERLKTSAVGGLPTLAVGVGGIVSMAVLIRAIASRAARRLVVVGAAVGAILSFLVGRQHPLPRDVRVDGLP